MKVRRHSFSLADGFAAALAKEKKAELVTGRPGVQGTGEGNQNRLAEVAVGNRSSGQPCPLFFPRDRTADSAVHDSSVNLADRP